MTYSIRIDTVDGTIMGLADQFVSNVDDNWFTTDEETYNFILKNNGLYTVDITSISDKIAQYKESLRVMKTSELQSVDIVVTKDNLKLPERDLAGVKINRIEKNNVYCNMYIKNGISYTFEDGTSKRYSYKLEDQINFAELRSLYTQGILSEEDKVMLKANEEQEYELVPIKIVIDIHNKLIKNKHYQLFYLRQMNNYVNSLTTINDVHRLQYEMNLPEEYQTIIDKQMETYANL